MIRYLAYAFVAIMLFTVAGQAIRLRQIESAPSVQIAQITQIALHESRLLAFLAEIRHGNRPTHDNIVLSISRIRDSQPQLQDYRLEERVVAEKLLERLSKTD